MGDIVVILIIVVIIGGSLRFIFLERKKTKAGCYGIGCIACVKARQCAALTPEAMLAHLRQEIHR